MNAIEVGGAIIVAATVVVGIATGTRGYSKKNPFIGPEPLRKRPQLHTGECLECGDWRDDCIKCKDCGEYVCCQGIQITPGLYFHGETTKACVYQHANFHCKKGWKRPAKRKTTGTKPAGTTETGTAETGTTNAPA